MSGPPPFRIRLATPADQPALERVLAASLAHDAAFTGAPTPSAEEISARVRAALFPDRGAPWAFAMTLDDDPAAAGLFWSLLWPGGDLAPRLFVKVLFVIEARRGQGVGQALMAAAEAEAARAGADDVELHVHPANDGARRFYERLGYAAAERLVMRRGATS